MHNSRSRPVRIIGKLKLILRHVGRGFSLIVAPHGTGTTVTLNLPGRITALLAILAGAVLVGAVFVSITYTRLAVLALEAAKLRSENQVLRTENEKIKQIEQEIAGIEKLRMQIEAWAGVVDRKGGETGELAGLIDLANPWPRRYSYAIMKPFYTGYGSSSHGMMLPAVGWISRGFVSEGPGAAAHPGIDIVAPRGTPVRSALDGVVKSAGWDEVYGNRVVVEHPDSLSTLYGHNDKILVKEGDHVAKGQVIATIGSTGRSTAPHLHFEILKNETSIDPATYFDLES